MHVYTYFIHSLDVLRLILSYFYLICALPIVIIGLVKGGGGGGSAPIPPLGETLYTTPDEQAYCQLSMKEKAGVTCTRTHVYTS